MFLSDYHVHTEYSMDSRVPIIDRVSWAVENNINELCLTDHLEKNFCTTYDPPDYKKYLNEIEKAKELYGDKINVKFGVELGLLPDVFDDAKKVVNKYDYDFVIGSIHQVNMEPLYFDSSYYKRDRVTAYSYYFEYILKNLKLFSDFDVYGHFDYIYRYSTYKNNELDYFEFKELIDTILKLLIEKGVGLEVNLSGFRYGLDAYHPSLDILKSYKNLGGEILTIGSDTHDNQKIKPILLKSQDFVKEAGFDYITTFEKRKPSFIKI